ncbi:piezo-type mechanosensitive ion channel component 1-like protein, partial [Leptotrombidium deliense]
AVVLRQNVFSGVYFILLLIGPFLPKPTPKSFKGSISIYLKVLILLSTIICISQVVFQIVLFASYDSYEKSFDYCSAQGEIYYSIGFNRLDGISFFSIFRLFVVDFVILIYTCAVYLIIRKIFHRHLQQPANNEVTNNECVASGAKDNLKNEEESAFRSDAHDYNLDRKLLEQCNKRRLRKFWALEIAKFLSEITFNVLLCGAAVLNPSITSFFYLLLFLAIATWIACNQKLGPTFEKFRLFVCLYTFVQLSFLFLYQMDYFHSFVEPGNLYARLVYFLNSLTFLVTVEVK